jgi:hypothetical protein
MKNYFVFVNCRSALKQAFLYSRLLGMFPFDLTDLRVSLPWLFHSLLLQFYLLGTTAYSLGTMNVPLRLGFTKFLYQAEYLTVCFSSVVCLSGSLFTLSKLKRIVSDLDRIAVNLRSVGSGTR